MKRFVVSSAMKLKHIGRLRASQQVCSEHHPVNATHFMAKESVFLSPHFLVFKSSKLRWDHGTLPDRSRISQMPYRRMNVFRQARPRNEQCSTGETKLTRSRHGWKNESGGDEAPAGLALAVTPSSGASPRSFPVVVEVSLWAAPTLASWLAEAFVLLSAESPESRERRATSCRSRIELGGE